MGWIICICFENDFSKNIFLNHSLTESMTKLFDNFEGHISCFYHLSNLNPFDLEFSATLTFTLMLNSLLSANKERNGLVRNDESKMGGFHKH